jgi:hypothetical protein
MSSFVLKERRANIEHPVVSFKRSSPNLHLNIRIVSFTSSPRAFRAEGPIMEKLWKNLTYSVRMLTNTPGFSLLAIIAIALASRQHHDLFCR